MSGRDYQRSRVYAWENRVVAPRDPSRLGAAETQPLVDAIWAEMGLRFPPKVEPLAPQASRLVAQASRLTIQVSSCTPSWCLLHELAHAMSMTHDGAGDGHGPVFMGLYLRLLERYMRLPAPDLLASLAEAGIDVDVAARPVFVD